MTIEGEPVKDIKPMVPKDDSKGTMSYLLDEFRRKEFWLRLAKELLHELVWAGVIAFAEVLKFHGTRRRNKEIRASTPDTVTANKAFGGSTYPPARPDYAPSSNNYPVSTNYGGDGRFPGFGR